MAFKDKEQRNAYQYKFQKENYERISIDAPKGLKEILKKHAAASNASLTGYLLAGGIYLSLRDYMTGDGDLQGNSPEENEEILHLMQFFTRCYGTEDDAGTSKQLVETDLLHLK